jgi:hypothetical protein
MLVSKLKFYFLIPCLIILASCVSPNLERNKTAAQILGDSNYLAICYGGYRSNTRDLQPSVNQIKDDLKKLRVAII